MSHLVLPVAEKLQTFHGNAMTNCFILAIGYCSKHLYIDNILKVNGNGNNFSIIVSLQAHLDIPAHSPNLLP